MKIKKWLEQVAEISKSDIAGDEDSDIYISKFDKSYITRVGMEKDMKFLAKRNITEQLTHGVGFSPTENKWYGWSHRAMYGFTIGSTCKKGDAHYVGSSIEEEIEHAISFWSDEAHIWTKAIYDKKERVIKVTWLYDESVPNKKMHNTISGCDWDFTLGRGEWTAKTMEDAHQMAKDFNEGVS